MTLMLLFLLALAWGILLFYWISPHEKPLHRTNRVKAKKLLKKLQKNSDEPAHIFYLLRSMNCFVFEELLLLCLKDQGFRIEQNQAYTGDGGIDGTFYDKQGRKFVVQAKRYKSAINPQHVSEFATFVENNQVAGGLFIHTGRTGKKSYQQLTSKIRIVSGQKLLDFIGVGTRVAKHVQTSF